MNEKKTPVQIIVRILIIIGLVILLLLLSFGIIKVVPKALNGLTSLRTSLFSLRSSGTERIIVSTDPVTYPSEGIGSLTWSQTNGPTKGYYTFEFSCVDGLTLQKVSDAAAASYSDLDCGQPFIVGDATTTNSAHGLPIRVINDSDQTISTDLVIAHRYQDSDEIYASGTSTITIQPSSTQTPSPAPVATSAPGVTYTPPAPAPAPTGPARLTVNLTQVTAPDPVTNLETVQFQVTNTGYSPSGSWSFTAYLPASSPQDQIYNSPIQPSIPVGKTSYFTLRFYPSATNASQISVVPHY